jgi:hypothetical protein
VSGWASIRKCTRKQFLKFVLQRFAKNRKDLERQIREMWHRTSSSIPSNHPSSRNLDIWQKLKNPFENFILCRVFWTPRISWLWLVPPVRRSSASTFDFFEIWGQGSVKNSIYASVCSGADGSLKESKRAAEERLKSGDRFMNFN